MLMRGRVPGCMDAREQEREPGRSGSACGCGWGCGCRWRGAWDEELEELELELDDWVEVSVVGVMTGWVGGEVLFCGVVG